MAFCGAGQFWNESMLRNNWWPEFAECFQSTVLVFVPCGWLWLTLPFYLFILHRSKEPTLPPTPLHFTKICLCFVLSLVTVGVVFGEMMETLKAPSPYSTSHYTARAVEIVTFVLAAVIIHAERLRGFITSGILFIFWLLLTVSDIIPLYTYVILELYLAKYKWVSKAFWRTIRVPIMEFSFCLKYWISQVHLFTKYKNQPVRFSGCAVTYVFILLQLVLHCFAEKRPPDSCMVKKIPSPEYHASFISRLTFWWMTKLIYTGFKQPLTDNDLFDLHPRDQGSTVMNEFSTAWKKELDKYKERIFLKHIRRNKMFTNGVVSEKMPLLTNARTQPKTNVKQAWLSRVLFKLYWSDLFQSFLAKAVSDILTFAGPLLLGILIHFIENKTEFEEGGKWIGYAVAVGLFCIPWCQSVFYHQTYHMAMTLGMRMKTALMAAIYDKALKLNCEAQRRSTAGEIVNLMAVDCQRIQDAVCYAQFIWSIPLQVALAIFLLWSTMGPSSLAGLSVLILLVPVNAIVVTKQVKFQKANLQHKDNRLKLTSEVLAGIKVLKLYAWEGSFRDKILHIRKNEMDVLMKIGRLNTLSMFVWTCAPYLVTLATFTTHVLTSADGNIDAQKAFVTLSLFNILQFPINFIPETISYLTQAVVSIKRIDRFLKEEELRPSNVDKNDFMGQAVKVEKGTFSWGKSIKPILSNINIDISEGELVAIVGSVGAGKSSVLSAMLGEMEIFHGKVASKGKIAYVSQQAWILNATVRENILFGSQMNKKQYKRAIEACALQEDLKILSGGDLTEIGEKGVTLSGGQKQRISLARAVYSDADVYLFDDPLSAVDSHVGKHIFKRVISDSGILKYKTRVFVTHAVHWLPLVDTVILLKEGKILESGSYIKLMRRHGYLADFLHNFYVEQESEHEEEEDPEVKELKSKVWDHVETVTSTSEGANSSDDNIVIQRSKWKSSPTESEIEKSIDINRSTPSSSRQISRLIDEEKAEVGRVRFAVFIAYAKAIGMCSTLFIFIFYTLYQGSSVAANILLSTWTDDPELQNVTLSQTSSYINKNHQYLTLFGVFGILQAVFILLYAAIANTQMVNAAGKLHSKMLTSIVKAPMSFFETTPIGRIVNRFSRDIETIDNLIPSIFSMWILTIFSVTSTILVICVTTPLFTIVVIPLVFMYTAIQKFFVPTSRQLKRLESVTKSPIYSHFGESIQGVLNIRAYEARERFVKDSRSLIDKNQIYYFARISANRWLGIWIEFISSCVVFAAALFSLLSPGATGGSLGLSVTYALQITSSLKWLVRTLSDLETNIVSVERVKEYSELKSEGSWVNRHNRPPVDWPEAGNIQFQLYSTRYRPGLDLVLKVITCDIKPGEKIGIVGRTGAGKSSFVLALFRLVESVTGSIYIDERRIDDMGLHDLRSKLTILPQDPVLFAGSLRMNLDPFGCYNDEDIWTALTLAHLKVYVKSLPGGLSYDCGEGGQNFSVGQRQLICLARALLRKTKVLILDEATAAVDLMTDNLIQETVRSEFKDCTILTVAHRINTIMDYDRVMVLGGGKIIEFDKPTILLQDEESSFYDLAKDADII